MFRRRCSPRTCARWRRPALSVPGIPRGAPARRVLAYRDRRVSAPHHERHVGVGRELSGVGCLSSAPFAQSPKTATGIRHPNSHVLHPPQSSAPFAQSAKQRKRTRTPINHVLRPRRPQGRKRRGSGGVTGVSFRNIPQDAKRLRSAKCDAEPLCMSEDVPEEKPRPRPRIPGGSSRPCRP